MVGQSIRVRLLAEQPTVRGGDDLPLRVELASRSDLPLSDATAELTLELERGVLVTWDLSLATVRPGGLVADAIAASTPDFRLPLNIAAGTGRFKLTVRDSDGAWLGQDELVIPVAGDAAS